MQDWILFETATNWDGQFVSQPHKKFKNKKNLIRAEEFHFDKFYRKNFNFMKGQFVGENLVFLIFHFCCAVEAPIVDLDLWEFEREFNFASSPFFLVLVRRIFDNKDFNFMKGKFVCRN